MTAKAGRRFLFLQGPHGPFYAALARMLRAAGADCWRVGFNAGDRAFWFDGTRYIAYRGAPEGWAAELSRILDDKAITDIVLYGDTRPLHAEAVAQGRARGLTVHVLEEGYLRPYWITYERGGSNGHSRLMEMSLDQMRAALPGTGDGSDMHSAPARWGDMREHIFYGALYHFFLLALNRGYRGYRTHRQVGVTREFLLHLKRLVATPLLAAERWLTTRRLWWSGHPYHLVLLQLAHDANFRDHGPFGDMSEFLDTVIGSFARGAPAHHRLVLKAHPLEDGRTPLRSGIRRLARLHGVEDRVQYVPGGKLARLLDEARSAVTVNSTSAQQALWRGLPVKALGRAVYAKPELVSDKPLTTFFAAPDRPDPAAYRAYRAYLLATSQVPGGFYALRSRRLALRRLVDMMLAPMDPYDQLAGTFGAGRQHLTLVAEGT